MGAGAKKSKYKGVAAKKAQEAKKKEIQDLQAQANKEQDPAKKQSLMEKIKAMMK